MREAEFALLSAVIFTAQVVPGWLALIVAMILYIMAFAADRDA